MWTGEWQTSRKEIGALHFRWSLTEGHVGNFPCQHAQYLTRGPLWNEVVTDLRVFRGLLTVVNSEWWFSWNGCVMGGPSRRVVGHAVWWEKSAGHRSALDSSGPVHIQHASQRGLCDGTVRLVLRLVRLGARTPRCPKCLLGERLEVTRWTARTAPARAPKHSPQSPTLRRHEHGS